ncbi:hypothetical protein Prudu_003979 [Prunus dulcis]|uniref:Uncharacterized protein n=1 Tax=Prunus dulcis TaxID=3755 RepID=A0A4Y1QUF2_PRUDU|nr:hypothetical protein Prudu_003979 [Prunus dulcis]
MAVQLKLPLYPSSTSLTIFAYLKQTETKRNEGECVSERSTHHIQHGLHAIHECRVVPARATLRRRDPRLPNSPRRKSVAVSFAGISAEMSPAQPGKPEIELEFIGPKPGNDGSYPVESAKAISGEKLLRDVMSDNKIELYATYIIDGKDLLNERTNTELKLWFRGSPSGKSKDTRL